MDTFKRHGSDIQLEDSVEREIERIAPGYIAWREAEVLFSDPKLIREYAETLYERLDCSIGCSFTNEITVDDLVNYFMTLVMIRVDYVNGGSKRSRDYDRFAVIPAFMSQYLRQIGVVISDGLGVTLRPAFAYDHVLDESAFRRVSASLRKMSGVGLEFTDAMPRNARGNWDFMSLQHLRDCVVSHSDEVHPSVALAGSFVDMKQVEEIFNPLVTYGSVSSYARVVSGLVESKHSERSKH